MSKATTGSVVLTERIAQSIIVLRGQRVLLDGDLAALYEVETRRLNEQVRRNRDRFPADFIFEVTDEEFKNLMSQFATSSWGGRRKRPIAFTEHGAIMARNGPQQPSGRRHDPSHRALFCSCVTYSRPTGNSIGFTANLDE